MKNIQNPISEYGPKGKLKYTGAKVGMNVTAGGQSAMGRLEKSGKMRGGGIAIKGTKFQRCILMNKKGSCWEGYVQKGMKSKGGRMVPNCVPGMKKVD
jgi:hypothetical protein